jgi:POT family proton-dependent oligopeptide transporter
MTDVASASGSSTPVPRKQPRGLYVLAGVEMWERFSYYGMRAFLVLFLTSSAGGWGWSKAEANTLYGWYTGLVYLTPLLGGYLADRVLGTHRAVIVGSFLIAAGHFCLAVPSRAFFFIGLSLVVLGTGFHKSNISTMVGQLFQQGDGRRDAAFTIFHMFINIGATLGPFVCGGLAESERFGWHWGFASAGVGMVLGTAMYLWLKRKYLPDIGEQPAARTPVAGEAGGRGVAGDQPLTKDDKQRIAAIALMAIFNIFFWSAYEQTGSSLNFFALERTDRMFLGIDIKTSWFQSINPIALIVFAPLFAALWVRLAARRREPSTPTKFVAALLLVAAGFAVMVVAALRSEGGVKVSPLFLVLVYLLHTWGEICLYPVGLSMVTKLAPVKFASIMMGMWFGSMAIADFLAGIIAAQSEKIEKGQLFSLLGGQADFFLMFAIAPTVGALILWAMTGKLKRLMHGRV